MDKPEVVVPHEASRGPLTAVRRMLVHSSIAELQTSGLYDRYHALIDAKVLAEIMALIGPGWMPVGLALAHYQACDRLALDDADIHAAGLRAGEKIGQSLLVAGTRLSERSPWAIVGAFSRMGRRIYEGSSSQYVKLAPNKLQIEYLGNPLFSLHYYRVAQAAFLRRLFGDLGVHVLDVTWGAYRAPRAEFEVRLTWK